MGSPGAVILYAILAVLLWPSKAVSAEADAGAAGKTVAEASPLHVVPARLLWIALWAGPTACLLLPANSGPNSLRDMVVGMAPGEPGWMRTVDSGIAAAVAGRGEAVTIVLAAVCLVTAAAGIVPLGILARCWSSPSPSLPRCG